MTADTATLLEEKTLLTDDLMEVVRERISQGGSELQRYGAFEMLQDDIEEVVRRGDFVLPEMLTDDRKWDLDPEVEISSHRKIVGTALVGLKRLALPLVGWIFDYSQGNFRRQRQLNHWLLASIETVAARSAALEMEVDRLRERLDEAESAGDRRKHS